MDSNEGVDSLAAALALLSNVDIRVRAQRCMQCSLPPVPCNDMTTCCHATSLSAYSYCFGVQYRICKKSPVCLDLYEAREALSAESVGREDKQITREALSLLWQSMIDNDIPESALSLKSRWLLSLCSRLASNMADTLHYWVEKQCLICCSRTFSMEQATVHQNGG